MKKNKTIAYAMAATLLVGGTFAGTKALYSANDTIETGLVITTGTVDVAVEDGGWYATQDGTETITLNEDFANAKPGDVFNKYVEVKNTGSLEQSITYTGGEVILENENLEISTPLLEDVTLQPGEMDQVLFMVKIKEDVTEQNISFDLSKNISPVEISAQQTPANK